MARVSSIAAAFREFTGGLDYLDVEATSVGALYAALDRQHPGLGRLTRERMALAIDGELQQPALDEALAPDAEVVLIPRIAGG